MAAQKGVASFSESALSSVRTKDLGEVGDTLSSLVVELKSFGQEEEEKGLFGFFKKAGNKMEAMKAQYGKAEANVEKIARELEQHQVVLMKDIAMFDQMYELNLKTGAAGSAPRVRVGVSTLAASAFRVNWGIMPSMSVIFWSSFLIVSERVSTARA